MAQIKYMVFCEQHGQMLLWASEQTLGVPPEACLKIARNIKSVHEGFYPADVNGDFKHDVTIYELKEVR